MATLNPKPSCSQELTPLYPKPQPSQVLCKGFPQEFVTYFQYVRSLRFDEKPDYAYLRRLFRDLFAKEGACMRAGGRGAPTTFFHGPLFLSLPLSSSIRAVLDWFSTPLDPTCTSSCTSYPQVRVPPSHIVPSPPACRLELGLCV